MNAIEEKPVIQISASSARIQPLGWTEPLKRGARFAGRQLDRLIGITSIVAGLAMVSVFPVLNLLSLGYFLEASSRVANSGRLRDGFVGIPHFARLGTIVLGIWLWTLPLRLIYSFLQDAELIAAGSQQANALRGGLAFLIVLTSLHLIAAVIRGAKLRHFLVPAPFQWIKWAINPDTFPRLKHLKITLSHVARRLFELARLGLLGFCGAAIWLALPVSILFSSAQFEKQGIALLGSLVGAILLGTVAIFIPFLQTRFSVTGNFREFFHPGSVLAQFQRAPLAFWLALSATLLLALPLYLLKIELAPQEVAWLPNILFVLFAFPARILLGWAMFRAERAATPKRRPTRWLSGLLTIPVVSTYAFVVWLSPYLSWHGSYSLFEQHAFLVPAPLFGL